MVTLEQIKGNGKNTESKLDVVRDNFVESVGKLSTSLGLSRVAGQIYGLLYISGGPLSLDDIAETLKVSKGNVSVNIRELEKWGAVRKVWVKGSRKDYYEVELDVLKVVLSRLKEGLRRRMDDTMEEVTKTTDFLDSNNVEFSPEERQKAAIYAERLKSVRELHALIKGFMGNISKVL